MIGHLHVLTSLESSGQSKRFSPDSSSCWPTYSIHTADDPNNSKLICCSTLPPQKLMPYFTSYRYVVWVSMQTFADESQPGGFKIVGDISFENSNCVTVIMCMFDVSCEKFLMQSWRTIPLTRKFKAKLIPHNYFFGFAFALDIDWTDDLSHSCLHRYFTPNFNIAFAFAIPRVINSEIILFRFALISVSMVTAMIGRQICRDFGRESWAWIFWEPETLEKQGRKLRWKNSWQNSLRILHAIILKKPRPNKEPPQISALQNLGMNNDRLAKKNKTSISCM